MKKLINKIAFIAAITLPVVTAGIGGYSKGYTDGRQSVSVEDVKVEMRGPTCDLPYRAIVKDSNGKEIRFGLWYNTKACDPNTGLRYEVANYKIEK